MTKRILFVDDEARILDGLRRLFRGRRGAWDMEFVESGAAALDLMERAPCDIVVSDMRMPGMNGAQLLAEIKNRYPDTIRIVLSGHAETDAIMQAFGVSHQYLSKPCEPDVLQATIDRAEGLRTLLHSETLTRIVTGTEQLPSMPAVYQQLVACLRAPGASVADVGRIISQDVGMTAAILKVVNSAFFGLSRPVADIDRAATILGLNIVMALALDHDLFRSGDAPIVEGFSLDKLRSHSLRTAGIARHLARLEPDTAATGDDAFLAGMLHDVGQLLLVTSIPERYAEVARYRQQHGTSWHTAEREVLEASHAEVGAYLLGLWGFGNGLVEAVAFHETPSASPVAGFGLAGLLHVAHCLAEHPDAADPFDPRLGLDLTFLSGLGLTDRWCVWREACRDMAAASTS
jgi:HD-like signal output (HDOD) protein